MAKLIDYFYQLLRQGKAMLRQISAIYLFVLLTGPVIAQTQIYVDVPARDVAALKQAILDANVRPLGQETIIRLSGEFSFASGDLLPHIEGDITIRGDQNPAIFQAEGKGPVQLFYIAVDATLRLINIEITDFSLEFNGGGLIENEGDLYLEQVQLSSINVGGVCRGLAPICTPTMSAISNRLSGHLDLDQVSIVNSGIFGDSDINSRS